MPVPVPATPLQAGWDALPAGWLWYLDPSGFRIAVRRGWLMTDGPDGACFREPGDTRVLAVEPAPPDGDPVARWRSLDLELTRETGPAAYHDLGITAIPYYFAGGAEWEYTYTDPAGTVQHGLSRDFRVSSSSAYVIAWRTRDVDWQPNLDSYREIIGSFRPTNVS
jgi:hypothetical protein